MWVINLGRLRKLRTGKDTVKEGDDEYNHLEWHTGSQKAAINGRGGILKF